MEKYTVSLSSPQETSKIHPRRKSFTENSLWRQKTSELNGKLPSGYYHGVSQLLLNSYVELRAFAHHYHLENQACPTHLERLGAPRRHQFSHSTGITGLEFDNKGTYLASVTISGCLTIHDFDVLYGMSNQPSRNIIEDEKKHLLHISTSMLPEVVRWNKMNQDEVACGFMICSKLFIYDIGYLSPDPVEVLEIGRSEFSFQAIGSTRDINFCKSDKFRLLGSNTVGSVRMWDRRIGCFPCMELSSNVKVPINSIQLDIEDRILFGASETGMIYSWDLRGGRSSFAFQSHNQVHHPILTTLKLAPMLEKISLLKAQTTISPRSIHSITFNPSCPYDLAFHLDDGWSGVLNVISLNVTHMHCPPPCSSNVLDLCSRQNRRKPSWLPHSSIYAAPSQSLNGIHLLDFYPDKRAGCHVDFCYDEEDDTPSTHGKFIELSETPNICASHPLNGTIVTGTKQGSLCLVSQEVGRE